MKKTIYCSSRRYINLFNIDIIMWWCWACNVFLSNLQVGRIFWGQNWTLASSKPPKGVRWPHDILSADISSIVILPINKPVF